MLLLILETINEKIIVPKRVYELIISKHLYLYRPKLCNHFSIPSSLHRVILFSQSRYDFVYDWFLINQL
jgi:hypothetical protein